MSSLMDDMSVDNLVVATTVHHGSCETELLRA